jgi:hypothetical protein
MAPRNTLHSLGLAGKVVRGLNPVSQGDPILLAVAGARTRSKL